MEEAEAIRPGRAAVPLGWSSPDPDTEREAPFPCAEVEAREVEEEAADMADRGASRCLYASSWLDLLGDLASDGKCAKPSLFLEAPHLDRGEDGQEVLP